jgi:hypothetical protein
MRTETDWIAKAARTRIIKAGEIRVTTAEVENTTITTDNDEIHVPPVLGEIKDMGIDLEVVLPIIVILHCLHHHR